MWSGLIGGRNKEHDKMYRLPVNCSPVDSSWMTSEKDSQLACGSRSGVRDCNTMSDPRRHLCLSRQDVFHRVGLFRKIAEFHHSRCQFLKSCEFRVCRDVRDDCFKREILTDSHGAQALWWFRCSVTRTRNIDEVRQVGRDGMAVKLEESRPVFSRLSMLRPPWSQREIRHTAALADGEFWVRHPG